MIGTSADINEVILMMEENKDMELDLKDLEKVGGGYGVQLDNYDGEGFYALAPFSVYSDPGSTSALIEISINNKVEVLDSSVVGLDGKAYTHVRTLYPNDGFVGYVLSSKIIYRK